jgi:dipeptidyl aminopeptidase/acylaminoacyl peptidase
MRKIYRFDPAAERPVFSEVNIPHPFVNQVGLSKMGRTLTYIASSPTETPRVFVYDMRARQERMIVDPNKNLKPLLNLATFERWNFNNSDGDLIDGWLFYPSDFTPQKSWPMVVYFYGGVGPRDERFTFTYHWWAANGYLVYVVNPVGAVGYGQTFSDKHVNDWGTLASRDIIEGTEKLTAEKPFIDRNRLSAYGGSYGGFIAMDVIAKTDLFAAAASMYGISNISSYFGGGIWGYTYGDIALAGSFPWNRKDVFVEKSPFFNADKVRTPLLLLHGTGDSNVPPSESDQMFVALKLLDRDVAYVQFHDEDHGIVNKFENYIEHRQMILEWFDKYCKDQPEGWETRWKE